ncbi:ProQ/FinO family protein [Sodalis endosymbiont of Spalangia cameroni]|uniref:ProQ/FinO family protein n=1 Tax=Sodalis praecaptivus TaxID=1239307 RepID=UPI0031F76185
MTEPKRPLLSIRRKPKIYVNPKHADKPAPAPKPAKPPKAKAPKPAKEPKPKQPPPKPLSREERIARNRAKKLRQGQEAIAGLITNWPALFDVGYPKPLKVGIAADIYKDIKARELELTRAKASAALMFYTQRAFYQQAVWQGGPRFDLRGQPCGEVTEEEQAHALKQLEKWRAEAESESVKVVVASVNSCSESSPLRI